ncbi:hypothetical protein HK405_007118, partial [Cladochytrium tenue]
MFDTTILRIESIVPTPRTSASWPAPSPTARAAVTHGPALNTAAAGTTPRQRLQPKHRRAGLPCPASTASPLTSPLACQTGKIGLTAKTRLWSGVQSRSGSATTTKPVEINGAASAAEEYRNRPASASSRLERPDASTANSSKKNDRAATISGRARPRSAAVGGRAAVTASYATSRTVAIPAVLDRWAIPCGSVEVEATDDDFSGTSATAEQDGASPHLSDPHSGSALQAQAGVPPGEASRDPTSTSVTAFGFAADNTSGCFGSGGGDVTSWGDGDSEDDSFERAFGAAALAYAAASGPLWSPVRTSQPLGSKYRAIGVGAEEE